MSQRVASVQWFYPTNCRTREATHTIHKQKLQFFADVNPAGPLGFPLAVGDVPNSVDPLPRANVTEQNHKPQIDLYLPRLVLGWDETSDSKRYRETDGTLVHVDISGFTALSERLARKGMVGSEEVAAVLNAPSPNCSPSLMQMPGDLLKFGGDALLLLFQGSDHAARACRAAHGMRQALRTVGNIQTSAGHVKLRMSVGVHSGAFDLMVVGSSHRELIVAGPAASQTIVMEEAAEAGEIMVSHATACRGSSKQIWECGERAGDCCGGRRTCMATSHV